MAINPKTQYPGKIAPSTPEYPYGKARNISTPGDGTGTPWEAALVNDIFGFQQALLSEASVVPSGNPDEVGDSQYLTALLSITSQRFDSLAAVISAENLVVGQIVVTTGYNSPGDGGGNVYEIVPAATGADDGGSFVDLSGSGHQAKGLFPGGVKNVKQFGAVGDGSTDDVAAFQAITTIGGDIHIPEPAVAYNVSLAIDISVSGTRVIGSGRQNCVIRSTSSSEEIFNLIASVNNIELASFRLDRTVPAAVGGNGIECSTVSVGRSRIYDIDILNQWRGLSLGPTDFSSVQNVVVEECFSDGVFITNTATDGACQWSLDDVLCQKNDGHGYYVQAITGPSQMTVGTWSNIRTFANSGRGVIMLGLAGTPIQGVRMKTGFLGEDGDSELYLDTFGQQHQVSDMFLELAGRSATGRGLATPASGLGSGLEYTVNNGNIELTGNHANGNSFDGLFLSGSTHTISGLTSTNNGQSAVAGRRNGVNLAAGLVVINGGYLGNTVGVSQEYGAFAADGNSLSLIGSVLTGNGIDAWGATTNLNLVTSMGNLPNTLDVGLSPAGAVMLGNATGGFVAAGTMNVAGGLLKSNVAYNNP